MTNLTEQERRTALSEAVMLLTGSRNEVEEFLSWDSKTGAILGAVTAIALEMMKEIDKLGGDADQKLRELGELAIVA